ncbi:hypothetical protein MTYM_02303 [Methylococcales bacterium]|nr:hypothetical protein MTYM_02303 [Methylococcales bacterium]
MKSVRYSAALFYYDGIQVFEARDAIGGHYVAVMVEPVDGEDRYLLAGVEPERLRQFRIGELDLRSLLLERAEDAWFIATPRNGFDAPLDLDAQASSLQDSPDLPDAGFLLHDSTAESETLREARSRNNLVREIAVEPPEAAEAHQIHAGTLAGLLANLQTLVKHAYGAALRDRPGTRRGADRADAHLLNVVIPAAAGSFRLVLEAATAPDMFGHSPLADALERIDGFFEHVDDPKQTLAMVKAHRGHFAGAYLRLLRFLVENKTGLRYAWAELGDSSPRQHAVTKAEAVPLVEYLSGVSNVGAETVLCCWVRCKRPTTARATGGLPRTRASFPAGSNRTALAWRA